MSAQHTPDGKSILAQASPTPSALDASPGACSATSSNLMVLPDSTHVKYIEKEDGVYIENAGAFFRVSQLSDFIVFKEMCLSEDKEWKLEHKEKDGTLSVDSRLPVAAPGEKPNDLRIFRVKARYENVQAKTLYDCLHDANYRKTWDGRMLEGQKVAILDPRNDIGYYAAESPPPLTNRDFCNLRSWMEFTNGEFIIKNYSVVHPNCPEKKKFIRARSILTGYLIRPNPEGGCDLVYMTHSDVKGNIPHSVLNWVVSKGVPKTIKNLEESAQNYPTWKTKNPELSKPVWRTERVPWDGSTLTRVSVSVGATEDLAVKLGEKEGKLVESLTPTSPN